MSASTEKKNRQAAREAGTDKKTLALEKEAQEQAKKKRRWTIGTVCVALVVVLVLVLNSGIMNSLTAFTVGDRNFNTSEVSYYYSNEYMNFANQYGSYASLIGLDTSNGIRGLEKQECPMLENGGTWKDYFMDAARHDMIQTTILKKYAAENSITLDADELSQLDASFSGIDEQARSYGYANGDKMLAANYGSGVDRKLVRGAYQDALLASKASEALSDSFTYTDAELEEKYESYEGSHDLFDYAYCYVSAERVDSTDADGNTSSAPTEETLAAAQATAEKIMETYKAAKGDSPAVRLNNAAESEGQSSNNPTRVQGSGVPASEWMLDKSRQEGDVTVEPDDGGCYVVVFLSRDDNHYATANVRHILVKAEADEEGNYTDEAKAAAKAKAEEILAEYESGDKTEESFAKLAEEYSEDAGSNTNGGLYENVAKGQMVQEFNDFCFGGHKSGDTGIVYGESGSYAGYHVMYYVGDGMLYSSSIAQSDMRTEAVEEWMTKAEEANPTKDGFGMKFVG